MTPILLLAAAVVADSPPDIIVNAGLLPQPVERASASTTIIPEAKITALGEPLVSDLLRLTPGLSVSASGGPGSQVQIRVRGAEANHTLLFIDGIQFNDPASTDEARFESLTSNGLGRIEVIRGPQSALFGSEALGGVVALNSPDPLGKFRASAQASYGSLNTRQAGATVVSGGEKAGITASGSWIKSDGIDILGGGHGDKDGYENKTFSFKAIARPGDIGEFGLVGRYVDYRDQFDGTDPNTFLRADTLDNSHAVTKAIRGWATLGRDPDAPWSGTLEAQYLKSNNDNFNDRTFLGTTSGDRLRISAQGVSRFDVGGSKHSLILRLEREDETFTRRDADFGGLTNLQRDRGRTTVIGEWQGSFGSLLDTDVAVRHDNFSDFRNATTARAGAVVHVTRNLALTGSYGDGISQPTFNDLFGFFPGQYRGNPNLKPERSRGFEAGVRWRSSRLDLTATAFSNRLKDEIVSVNLGGGLSSADNASGKSRRRGIELTGEWRPLPGLTIDGDYTYLDANQPATVGGGQVREVRRPKHTANLSATYATGRLTLAGSVAYVGNHIDTDFDLFPSPNVTLHGYALVSGRVAYRILPQVELFVRGDNLGGAKYQDIVGYATAGRTVTGGARVVLGE